MQSAASLAAATTPERPERDRAIDTFRGVLLALMVIANYFGQVQTAPFWLHHAQPLKGITVVDLGFPFFLFILGLVLPGSLKRRLEQKGTLKTTLHFLKRYLLLILFGIAGNLLLGQPVFTNWSVLQSIGLAGLISLPFSFLPPVSRLICGIFLFGLHQAHLYFGYENWLLANEEGGLAGIFGGFAWAGVILVASFVGAGHKSFSRALFTGILLSLTGVLLSISVPVAKPLATISYTLFTTGLASLGLTLFLFLDRFLRIRLNHFAILGVNPLFVYMLSGILGTIFAQILPAPQPLVMIALAGTIYSLTFLCALFLYKRNWLLKL
ncbi:MAG: DUF5009 domain-containing protein [candidate division WOR-3 bacterium]